jgi:hypothetical protein
MVRTGHVVALLLTVSVIPASRCLADDTMRVAAAPEVFAPGVISGPANDGSPTFTPDGNTLYFARSGANWGFILESHKVDGQWSEPHVASFSGQFSDSQPVLSPDGKRLIFTSTRTMSAAGPNGTTVAPRMVIGNSGALWEVDRIGDHWSEPVRLPETVNLSPRVFKATIAGDGSLYFMAMIDDAKTWRLYRSQYRDGFYQKAEPLSFSDGNHTDVDPQIAANESFLIFSSAGRAQPDDAHEHLYIVFKEGTSWGTITPVRYEGDYEKGPADDGEANLGPDSRTLYFTSSRTVRVHATRTKEEATEDFKRLNLWDNSNNNVWTISLAPWLDKPKAS